MPKILPKHVARYSLLILFAMNWAINAAQAKCNVAPAAVQVWQDAHADWSLLQEKDFNSGDFDIWRDVAKGSNCPGLVSVDLDGSGQLSYLALFRREKGNDSEQWLILFRAGSKVEVQRKDEFIGKASAIIYKAKPGRYMDWFTMTPIVLRHEGFIYRHPDGPTFVYFLKHGRMDRIVIFD